MAKKVDKGRKAVEKKANALGTLRVTYARAIDISPNQYNPNRQSDHDFELLVRSMLEDGFTQPIVAQDGTLAPSGEIVDGEHRWTCSIVVEWLRRQNADFTAQEIRDARERRIEILEKMPDLEIPVVFVAMTREQARIATLRHNRARGSEDIELSAQVLRDLRELGALDWAADSLMLDDVELQRLLEDVPVPEVLQSEDFSQAWAPTLRTDTSETRELGSNGGTNVVSSTTAATESLRQAERRVAEARTGEEKKAAQQDIQIYRLNLVFSSEQAILVKAALGDNPADALLELCRLKVESQPAG
jgi:ParB-like chromosome segregation protein Spo0J